MTELLAHWFSHPTQIQFANVIALIESEYEFSPCAFENGALSNKAEQNQGSCKLFAFAKLQGLSAHQTLTLFGEHYRSVLAEPEGDSHQNIRQFMTHGWHGIRFTDDPLTLKVRAPQ